MIGSERPYIALLVKFDSLVTTLRQLDGKTVGVNGYKTVADTLLGVALARLKPTIRVNVIELPLPLMEQAVVSGTIDAYMSSEPYTSKALSSGKLRSILSSEDIIPSLQLSSVFLSPTFVRSNKDGVARLQAAYSDAIDMIQSNPNLARDIVSKRTNTPLATAKIMSLPGWSKTVPVDGMENVQNAMIQNGFLDSRIDLKHYILGDN